MANYWDDIKEGQWTRQDWVSDPWRKRQVDPYLVWADATQFVDLGGKPGAWVPIIVELTQETTARKFAREMARRPDNQGDRQWIQIHPVYHHPASGLEDTRFCTAIVTSAFFEKLVTDKPAGKPPYRLGDLVQRFELGLPIVSEIDVAEIEERPLPGRRHRRAGKPSCVVGIIDDGLAFAHERFRNPRGLTRIEFLWDQGYYSPGFVRPHYGRELTNAEIDRYVADSTFNDFVDEDAVYRLAGYQAVRRRIAHGTCVLDITAGSDPSDDTPEPPRIIGVQLQAPSRKTRDRSAGWLAVRVLDGLRYILDRADEVAPKGCPVVANLSFGNIAGPHDGSSILERAIDELIVLRRERAKLGFEVIFGAGNSNLVRCHARCNLEKNKIKQLIWRVLPDDPTPNFMEIWLPQTAKSASVDVQVTPPWGEPSGFVRVNQAHAWKPGGNAVCTVIHLDRVATGDRSMILLAIAPTATTGGNRDLAPCGEWKVDLANRDDDPLEVHAWIQRDETPFDFPRHGRQSRFADPNYRRFEEFDPGSAIPRLQGRVKADDEGDENPEIYVRRKGTINSIATGQHTIAIGGCRRSDGAAVPYSSSGPGIQPAVPGQSARPGPDASAVSDDSVTCHGVLTAGARSGSVVVMDGTSVAAPQIARERAKEMSTGKKPPRKPRTRGVGGSRPGAGVPTGREAVQLLAAEREKQSAAAAGTVPAAPRAGRPAPGPIAGRRAGAARPADPPQPVSPQPAAPSTPGSQPTPPVERVGFGRIILPARFPR